MKLFAVLVYWVIVALWLSVLATVCVAYVREARRPGPLAYDPEDCAADHPARAVCHLVLTLPEFQLN